MGQVGVALPLTTLNNVGMQSFFEDSGACWPITLSYDALLSQSIIFHISGVGFDLGDFTMTFLT